MVHMEGKSAMRKTADRTLGSSSVYNIAATIEQRINAGIYRSGLWLPTERALAAEFNVSRAILRLALAELEQRDLVTRTAGCRPIVRGPQAVVPARAATERRSIGL